MLENLPKIHFFDESRVILGADRQWIWYRSGEDNLGASMSLIKFPPIVMVQGRSISSGASLFSHLLEEMTQIIQTLDEGQLECLMNEFPLLAGR
jgi:hypothetical protein